MSALLEADHGDPLPPAGAGRRPAPGRLLPGTGPSGPIPWVIAILIALVVVAAAGGLALRNVTETTKGDLSGAVTVQVIEADPGRRANLAARAADALQAGPAVTSVRVVPEAELAELLEPWLGAGFESAEVPIPALIDVELSQRATPQQVQRLRTLLTGRLGADARLARIDAQSDWLQPVFDALAALQWLALALIALVALATAAAVWLAARNAFANHRETIEIVHLLGGSDRQVTGLFQKSVLRDAAIGAVAGFALGAAAVWLLAQQFAALDSGMAMRGGLGWSDWLAIAAIPLAAVLLALVTGRITIGLALKSLL